MNNQRYNLAPIWNCLIEIYQQFAKICDRHGLRYCAIGGTALGAMRHGGFIPWDDDLDLVMPREDYRRFFDLYYQELPSEYLAEDFHKRNDRYKTAVVPWGKIYDVRSGVVEKLSRESNLRLSQGVFIDVIPIDGIPSRGVRNWWWRFTRELWLFSMRKGTGSKWKIPIWRLARMMLGTNGNPAHDYMLYEKWRWRLPFDASERIEDVNASDRRMKYPRLSPATYFPTRMVDFAGVKMPMPNETEHFLEVIFGDWRKLPPEDQRAPSHQLN